MIDFLFRRYLYVRRGLGHVSIVFSAFTAVNTFYLISRDWQFFSDLGYVEIMLFGTVFTLLIVERLGWWDYKKGFFKKESMINIEQNPYTTDLMTEKERKYILPVSLASAEVSLRINRALAAKFELNSPEIESALCQLQRAKNCLEQKTRSNGQ